MKVLLRVLSVLVVLLIGASAASTTAAHAAACTYDLSSIARVDVHEIRTAEACRTLLGHAREQPVWPFAEVRGASTTPSAVNATNTVDTSIFRGVASDHHAYDDAVRGFARPGDVNGVSDVALHNAGFTHGTDLTSWSTRLSTADDFAGSGGVVLETTVESLQRRGVQILTSPDAFNEAEILVKGAFGGLRIR